MRGFGDRSHSGWVDKLVNGTSFSVSMLVLVMTRIVVFLVFILTIVEIICLTSWIHDQKEIEQLIEGHIDPRSQPSEIVHQTMEFMMSTIPTGLSSDCFLLPVFRPLKPTALQIIEGGGDCAYLGRAFIVILKQFDIDAHKISLYDKGVDHHAVVCVETERGPLIVDLLFYLAHEAEDGTPVPLGELAKTTILQSSVKRNSSGVQDPWQYPTDVYHFRDARSFNWSKLGVFDGLYTLFSNVFGEAQVNRWKRPYITEDPALMVLAGCIVTQIGLLSFMWGLKRSKLQTWPRVLQGL